MIFGSKYDPYNRKFGGKGKRKKGPEMTHFLVWMETTIMAQGLVVGMCIGIGKGQDLQGERVES